MTEKMVPLSSLEAVARERDLYASGCEYLGSMFTTTKARAESAESDLAAMTAERNAALQAVDAFADICDELGVERDNEAGLLAAAEMKASLAAMTTERDQWQKLATEDVEALQAIGEEFGILGGENRVSGVRRILTEQRASLAAAREALEPFASEKLPGSNRDLIEYDRHGLRRYMSPMEIARRNAFFTLHPEEHPLAKAQARAALAGSNGE